MAEIIKVAASDSAVDVKPSRLASYFAKWRGVEGKRPGPRPPLSEIGWAFVGSFIGVGLLAVIHYFAFGIHDERDLRMLIGAFGATAVLVYGVPSAPLAQPRNCVLGHLVSAFIGVSVRELLVRLPEREYELSWLAATLSVSLSLCTMMALNITHPPGSATALIATMLRADSDLRQWGWLYLLVPALSGAVIMTAVALVVNNCSSTRRYPQYW
jgi:CBS-domain-containing membrane protein